MAIDRDTLIAAMDAELQPERFQDFGPNGLQVEGRREIRRIVSGVTASRALIDAAIAARADVLFVHHGLFWRGQRAVITGWLKERVQRLLAHDVNLVAYHLPLDAHPTLGNNAQLARVLGLTAEGYFGEQALGVLGRRSDGAVFADAQALARHVQSVLGRAVICAGQVDHPISRIAWCSGGAQGFFEGAIEAGADAFITGEISEPQPHLARECGVAFIAAGHHATERYGAPAFAQAMAERFGLEHEFIDIDNPA